MEVLNAFVDLRLQMVDLGGLRQFGEKIGETAHFRQQVGIHRLDRRGKHARESLFDRRGLDLGA